MSGEGCNMLKDVKKPHLKEKKMKILLNLENLCLTLHVVWLHAHGGCVVHRKKNKKEM